MGQVRCQVDRRSQRGSQGSGRTPLELIECQVRPLHQLHLRRLQIQDLLRCEWEFSISKWRKSSLMWLAKSAHDVLVRRIESVVLKGLRRVVLLTCNDWTSRQGRADV